MDPYLEGYLWADVHNALASKIRQQLVPKLRPRYIARLEIYLVEDTAPEGEIGVLYPDVEVLRGVQLADRQSTEASLPTSCGCMAHSFARSITHHSSAVTIARRGCASGFGSGDDSNLR
jgi:hypothetical protein